MNGPFIMHGPFRHELNRRTMSGVFQRICVAIVIFIFASACGAAPITSKPVIAVIAPADGATFAPGEQVNLRVSAVSSRNISKIEVHAGGALVASQVNQASTPTFTAAISWVPSQAGELQLTITSIDATGVSSDPVYLTINIGSSSVLGTAIAPTQPVSGTVSPQEGGGCKLGAAFVTDVSIPDGTSIHANTEFTKTWQLRNTSSCAWDNNYALAYSEGAQMGAPASVPVPPVAPDASVNVSVPFMSPAQGGIYTSTWRMRSPGGTPFGNRVYVVIRVP